MKKLTRRNDTMDSVCEVVGFSSTIALMYWFGGSNVCVPSKPGSSCMLSAVLGERSLQRMVQAFGGCTLWIPTELGARYKASDARVRSIVIMLKQGASREEVTQALGVSPHIVARVCKVLMLQSEGRADITQAPGDGADRDQSLSHPLINDDVHA